MGNSRSSTYIVEEKQFQTCSQYSRAMILAIWKRTLIKFTQFKAPNWKILAFKFLSSLKQLDLHLPYQKYQRNTGWQEELSSFISHPGLEKVRLGSGRGYCKFHPSILNRIAQKCNRLKELVIDSSCYTEETKGSLGQIKTLNSLEFNWKHYFKPFQVKQLLKDLLQNLALETLTFEVRNPDVRNSLEPVIPKILTMTKLRYLRIFDFETEFEIERDPRILECLENYPQYDPTSSITKCFISYPFGHGWVKLHKLGRVNKSDNLLKGLKYLNELSFELNLNASMFKIQNSISALRKEDKLLSKISSLRLKVRFQNALISQELYQMLAKLPKLSKLRIGGDPRGRYIQSLCLQKIQRVLSCPNKTLVKELRLNLCVKDENSYKIASVIDVVSSYTNLEVLEFYMHWEICEICEVICCLDTIDVFERIIIMVSKLKLLKRLLLNFSKL